MTVKHTLPFGSFFRPVSPSNSNEIPEMVITAENGCPLAVVSNHREYKEHAEFIVRACNSHHELIAVLEEMMTNIEFHEKTEGPVAAPFSKARAAIAKATGAA